MSGRHYICDKKHCFFCQEMDRVNNGDYREWRWKPKISYQNKKQLIFKSRANEPETESKPEVVLKK
jgi:hypothetical protein